MNVEELRAVQRTERQKDSLQHLRDSFYRDVADYIAERKAERERVAAETDDPFSSPEVSRLTDEIGTAEEVVESIYERRIGKIVKRATFAAAGMAAEDEGLTSEERELFENLVARIEDNRHAVLDELVGEADADAADSGGDADAAASADPASAARPTDDDPTDAPPPADGRAGTTPDPDDLLADAMGGESGDGDDPPETPGRDAHDGTSDPAETAENDGPATDGGDAAGSPDTDRTTLRITRDVGEIFGVDEREYDLASEDVVTLPTANAEPLLDRDAAERLDGE